MGSAKNEAFWITGPGKGEIRSQPVPEPRRGELLVRTLYSGVSRGTEALVFQGRVPESQYRAMRAPFQEGDFPAPVKYGYINVGRVERGPANLRGRAVFSLFPHQRTFALPADAAVPIPDGLPVERAILAANMETAVNGLWDAGIAPGDRIAVIGAGTVGCLMAYLAERMPGSDVTLMDIDENKRSIAESLGITFAGPEGAPTDCDIVLHASGTADGLESALSAAGMEARIVEMSWYGDQTVTVPLGETFHSRRLTLRSSQVGTIPPARAARWDSRRRRALALELLRDPVLDVLIGGESPFESLPETMARLAAEPGRLCHRIVY